MIRRKAEMTKDELVSELREEINKFKIEKAKDLYAELLATMMVMYNIETVTMKESFDEVGLDNVKEVGLSYAAGKMDILEWIEAAIEKQCRQLKIKNITKKINIINK